MEYCMLSIPTQQKGEFHNILWISLKSSFESSGTVPPKGKFPYQACIEGLIAEYR